MEDLDHYIARQRRIDTRNDNIRFYGILTIVFVILPLFEKVILPYLARSIG